MGLIERTLDKASYFVDQHGNKVDPQMLKGKNDDKEIKYFIKSNGSLSDEEVRVLNKKSNWALITGLTGASIGTVAWTTAFAMDLSTNQHWRRKQSDYEKLFIQGKRIEVNKQELAALLEVINEKLGVQISPNVRRFLFKK